jgi:hypothetical protein
MLELKRVKSSDGIKEYVISLDGERLHCSCDGFKFRRACSHVKGISQSEIEHLAQEAYEADIHLLKDDD